MKRYRRGEVEVEAMQWTGSVESINEISTWIHDHPRADGEWQISYLSTDRRPVFEVLVLTPDGLIPMCTGDHVVRRELDGHSVFNVYNADVFEATHAEVPNE